ncbi:M20 family metallopeptidase [Aliivibrio fischeri]|uniref:M20 family metallopeptidase n=1 Tax=Aliivibrio fischeri TaxID=668 RepID=UPI0012DA919D|nr:M20 family metallopeptidase [Aliivibrio fischeri]MUK68921.1 M20/M25/M40 family metallo-hydrolase [Aliivibrio fischeri]MUK73382.1 M20/M25/M40 family metallo-hydrolase [Aliivibrio fischeri]
MIFLVDDYIAELRQLVNVDCGTYTTAGVESILEQMKTKYQSMGGWTIKQIDCGIAGYGLEIRNKPNSPNIDVMLLGHMDTVFPVGTAEKRPMRMDDENIYGPGVSDMKSGLLNIVYAMRNLGKDTLDKLSICVCINPDEEVGSPHSVEWLKATASNKVSAILVAEAARADGSLISARKGNARYRISFHGVASHAGNDPLSGRSAITEMANWILFVNSMTNFKSGTTLNVGTVSGGVGANIVPELSEILLDVRFWCNESFNAIDTKLREMENSPFTNEVSVKLVRETYKPSMQPNAKTEELMSIVGESAAELGIDVTWKSVGGGSDANHVSIFGVPTLDGFGPIGGKFHSEDEYLVITSIEQRIRLLIGILSSLAKKV